MSFNELLAENYALLSESDIHISKYILANLTSIQSMSINEVAKVCSVSRSTIMRFAQKLNLSGFTELKMLLRFEKTEAAHNTTAITNMACDTYINTVHYYRTINYDNIFEEMLKAKRIFIYGTGSHQRSAASELSRIFAIGGMLAYVIAGEDEFLNVLTLVQHDDIIFVISKSGNNAFLNQILSELVLRNITIISVTMLKNNPLSSLSDYKIFLPVERFQGMSDHPMSTLSLTFLALEIFFFKFIDYQKKR